MGISLGSPPPSTGNTPTGGVAIEVDRTLAAGGPFRFAANPTDPALFRVLGARLLAGRWFGADEAPTNAIVPQVFARRFWPDGEAVGHTFRAPSWFGRGMTTYEVIGVVSDYRTDSRKLPAIDDDTVFVFTARQPPPPEPPQPARRVDTGGSYGFITVTVRMDSPTRAGSVIAAVRSVDPRLAAELEFVDDRYAVAHQATLLATQVVGAFGILAFLVAVVGVYGVMAYLVTGRTREIGIRMALGADRGNITRLVLGSSLVLAGVGAALGLLGAAAGARWVESQLYGVRPLDPAIYASVGLSILIAAVVATWQPARQAAHVDPAITLRAE
jgi:hypothetical protein